MPLAFAASWLVSVLDRSQAARDVATLFDAQYVYARRQVPAWRRQ